MNYCVIIQYLITYEGQERCVQGFWWGNLRERDHLEDPGVEEGLILRGFHKMWGIS
jgi:hypothetical protein